MGASTLYSNLEGVYGSIVWPRCHADFPYRNIGCQMDTKRPVSCNKTGVDEDHGSIAYLFSLLEAELHLSLYFVSMATEYLCCKKQGGCMAIMTTGMHYTFLMASVGAGGILSNMKVINISAEREC